ncbi:MAG: cupin domain-containing protein [Rhizobiales bacterium]|nr:cupin domain-containing protein [Hyphomicrobiales bacterium]
MASVNRKTRTATRSGRQSSSAKRRATSKRAGPPRRRQAFIHSHYREEDFASGGLRRYAKYRDLGISKATHGLARAHVIRFVPPFRPEEVSIRHYHDVDFQMVYVLKGWIKTELEGQGAITMRAGSSWIQPPRIKHSVLGYSDDCEVLEVILPADFETVMLDK